MNASSAAGFPCSLRYPKSRALTLSLLTTNDSLHPSLFYSVSKKGDRSQAIQDEVRSKIVAAMVRHGPAIESVGK